MLPAVKDAKPVKEYVLGGRYTAMLFTNCVSVGAVEYIHMLAVFDRQASEPGQRALPTIVITAETNPHARRIGDYFLCACTDGSHMNFGHSPDCRRLDVFEPLALEKAREQLQITESPRVILDFGTETPLGLEVAKEQIKINEPPLVIEPCPRLPVVKESRLVREYHLGPYTARLFTDCVNIRRVEAEYIHILQVYDDQDPQSAQLKEPVLVVTAETDALAKSMGEYFLSAYYEGVRAIYSHSWEYRYRHVFERLALDKAKEHLQIAEMPRVVGEIGFDTPLGLVANIVIAFLVGVGLLIGAGLVILVIYEFIHMFSNQPPANSGTSTFPSSLLVIGIIFLIWRSRKK